jgi:hypothetical protein
MVGWPPQIQRRKFAPTLHPLNNEQPGPVGGAIGITKEQWEAVNEYPEYPVMLETDHETGRYLASLDVFHQLHCVVSDRPTKPESLVQI